MKIKIKPVQTCIRTIRSGDPKWFIKDGMFISPRAGFEINENCPKEYRQIIMQAIQYGWLKPVANVKDNELFWEALQ